MKKTLPFLIMLTIAFGQRLNAQTAGDYRSIKAGAWDSTSTWEMFDGAGWIPAVLAPGPLTGLITINDSIVVNGTDSAGKITVTSTGGINILSGKSLKLIHGTGTDVQCAGRLIIGVGGAILANDTSRATVSYTSAAELDIDGAFNAIATFAGTAPQSVYGATGSGYFGPQVTLNNTAGVTIKGVVGFSGVNFVAGKMFVPGYFILGQFSGTNFTGQSSTSFIDGNISCIVYDDVTPGHFELPMGIGNSYLPVRFYMKMGAGATETGFTISIKTGQPPAFSLPGTLTKVSDNRYYNITNPANMPIDSASLEISYDAVDAVSDAAHLRLAKSDTTGGLNTWVDLGGEGSGAPTGTIDTKVNFTSLGDFVLANATGGTNTLPLRITQFSASLVKQAVQLNWSTSNEVNTDRFAIERKQAGTNWQTIGTMPANRQAAANTYSYLDVTAKNNSTYLYRINEIDKDGSMYPSKTLQVVTGFGKMNVSLAYPNPANDVLHYYISAANNDAITVLVTTTGGKTVQQQKGVANESNDLHVKSLPAGAYFMTVINEKTGEKAAVKFIVR